MPAALERPLWAQEPAAPAREDLLQVEHLCKDYALSGGLFGQRRRLRALDDVFFTVARGETLGISENQRPASPRSPAFSCASTSRPPGEDIFSLPGPELLRLRRRVQMVFQAPGGSLNPRMDVATIVSEPWRIHGDILPKARARDRVVELLELVGLRADHAARYPHQFSGGQQQRIAIARALASVPELIVCDEAASALDVSIQRQVVELLADLCAPLGLSYIFITHGLPIVHYFADRILVMCQGRVVEEGATEAIFGSPSHTYTRKLLDAVPRPKWLAEPDTDPIHPLAQRSSASRSR